MTISKKHVRFSEIQLTPDQLRILNKIHFFSRNLDIEDEDAYKLSIYGLAITKFHVKITKDGTIQGTNYNVQLLPRGFRYRGWAKFQRIVQAISNLFFESWKGAIVTILSGAILAAGHQLLPVIQKLLESLLG